MKHLDSFMGILDGFIVPFQHFTLMWFIHVVEYVAEETTSFAPNRDFVDILNNFWIIHVFFVLSFIVGLCF
jgi:hypothetical protein